MLFREKKKENAFAALLMPLKKNTIAAAPCNQREINEFRDCVRGEVRVKRSNLIEYDRHNRTDLHAT